MSLQHLDALLSYGGLVTLATLSVYFGSLGSYKSPKQNKQKPSPGSSANSEDDSEDDEVDERLSASDAIWFPVIGSVVLGGFYLAFKYFGDDWINKLMGYYFLVMGVGCVWKCLTSITKQLLGPRLYKSTPRFRPRLRKGKPLLALRLPTLLLFPISVLPSLSFFFSQKKSALMTDLLALSFAHSALSTLKLDSLLTGCVLLGGLFFYDIWWVFGTSVMVTVATSLDVPIKLLFPRSVLSLAPLSLVPSPSTANMLLGLGDVVIPGTLVALAYRLDMHLQQTGKRNGGYFKATLVGYSVGLSMAFAAMHTFKTAQPALLYLSPTCCLSFIFNAVQRNELGYVWGWEDGANENKEKTKESKESEGKTS